MSRTPAAFLALLLQAAPLAAAGPAVTGAPETVYDWAAGRCATWDIPDTPARAWRAPDGSVRLVAGAEESRAAAGPDLAHLTRDCRVLYRGGGSPDPGAYDDRAWIHSTWTADGVQVVALAHVEYHGEAHPGRCHAPRARPLLAQRPRRAPLRRRRPDLRPRRARRRAPLALLRRRRPPRRLLQPQQHRPRRRPPLHLPLGGGLQGPAPRRLPDAPAGRRRPRSTGALGTGTRSPRASPTPTARTWRDPAAHTCAPLAGVASTISSVVRSPSGSWLAVTPAARDGVSGVWWMTSPDLLSWSEPALLWQVPLLWRRDCAAPAAYAYPSLLDPASPARNFDTVSGAFWLYLVEMPLGPGCTVGPERDLIRLPVSWPSP